MDMNKVLHVPIISQRELGKYNINVDDKMHIKKLRGIAKYVNGNRINNIVISSADKTKYMHLGNLTESQFVRNKLSIEKNVLMTQNRNYYDIYPDESVLLLNKKNLSDNKVLLRKNYPLFDKYPKILSYKNLHGGSTDVTEEINSSADNNVKLHSDTTWDDLKLDTRLMQGVNEIKVGAMLDQHMKWLFPVQKEAIPIGLQGFDMFVKATTGTGKTYTFGSIAMSDALKNPVSDGVHTLIISPKVPLSVQTCEKQLKPLGKYTGLRIHAISKHDNLNAQVFRAIKNNECDILCTTMGTLVNKILSDPEMKKKFSTTRMMIIDELDDILNPSNARTVANIFSALSPNRQTLMFSATTTADIKKDAEKYLKPNYKFVEIANSETNAGITYNYIPVTTKSLISVLYAAIYNYVDTLSIYKCIVFCDTTIITDLYEYIFTALAEAKGFTKPVKFYKFYGKNLSNKYKDNALVDINKVNNDHAVVIFSSNIASRGLDVTGLTHTIQVGFSQIDIVIQRSGRTARAGEKGTNLMLLMDIESKKMLPELNKFKIEPTILDIKIPNLVPLQTILSTKDAHYQELLEYGYKGYIGGYLQLVNALKMPKQELIDNANDYFTNLGITELPEVSRKIAKKWNINENEIKNLKFKD
jgi:superfamily II DNA/RNA helicase